ncbi:bifunctional metallophosphatase/5'-nucleotidase [Microbacterium suwonense]|uniref:Gram-positive cocci surface proteins LPxTG domain-containing protein n=1 Tax=Microbacterium suwonense TaxID=683047 RepID=A0ABN6X331_9MICO|nr:5'-nucleotidase [Microbacterium suwonense]BDZ39124.1 hypothetical protein GCM10025863_17380 [Microbacterium suwonense]
MPNYPAVPAVQSIVDEAKKEADVLGAVKVGEITADLNRARQSDGSTENRGGESTIGNFVADVQQWSTGAQIALMNPGGIRANLTYASTGDSDPDGNVTYREAATVQPFANTLVTLQLTGAQLKSVLEEQWQPDGASRPFLKLGVSKGLTYTYDPTAAKGSHITSITLNGTAIDPAASYLVAANSFLAAGGDNFFTLADGADKKDTGKVDLQSMVDWFTENKTASPDLAQRAVGVAVTPAGAAPGDQVTVDLSSLAFSAGETAPTSASVSLDGVELATAAIDPTVVDATDEVGRASLTFTVPADAHGAQTLTVATDATGTTVEVPVTFATTAAGGTIALDKAKVAAGGSVTVTGEGFAAGEKLTIELRSTPVTLGTVTAAADGTFSTSVVIPKSTAAGAHTIAVIQSDGAEATAALTVTEAAGAGDDLAITGADSMPYLLLAALLLATGLGLVVLRRRRAARH